MSRLRNSVGLILAAAAMLLAGCDGGQRSAELRPDGAITYLDSLPAEEAAAMRQHVVQALRTGLGAHRMRVGDTLEVVLYTAVGPSAEPYLIMIHDELQLEIPRHKEMSKTARVRPDGKITLAGVGDIAAAGRSPEGLAGAIREILRRRGDASPTATVAVAKANGALEELIRAIDNSQVGHGRRVAVMRDGRLSLPFIDPVKAAGRSIDEVRAEVDAGYLARGINMQASMLVTELGPDRITVIGEVPRPGVVSSSEPQTALMAVANAGGVLPTGTLEHVKVFYIHADGEPRIRTVNLLNVLERLQLQEDLIVPPGAVVFVPPTALAKAGRFVDQAIRQVLLFQGAGIGVGLSYGLNPAAR